MKSDVDKKLDCLNWCPISCCTVEFHLVQYIRDVSVYMFHFFMRHHVKSGELPCHKMWGAPSMVYEQVRRSDGNALPLMLKRSSFWMPNESSKFASFKF